MRNKPVVLRQQAERDIEQAVEHYADAEGAALGLRFIGALEVALRQVGARPSAGSPRYAIELELPGLRAWALKRFPYVIFYVDGPTQIDVWRVLHGKVDIPGWLHAGE